MSEERNNFSASDLIKRAEVEKNKPEHDLWRKREQDTKQKQATQRGMREIASGFGGGMRDCGERPWRQDYSSREWGVRLNHCKTDPKRRWREALHILDDIPVATGFHYSIAMAICGKAGQWRIALELLDKMNQRGIARNGHCYSAGDCPIIAP
jgi:pentatricopeptide repeat protein